MNGRVRWEEKGEGRRNFHLSAIQLSSTQITQISLSIRQSFPAFFHILSLFDFLLPPTFSFYPYHSSHPQSRLASPGLYLKSHTNPLTIRHKRPTRISRIIHTGLPIRTLNPCEPATDLSQGGDAIARAIGGGAAAVLGLLRGVDAERAIVGARGEASATAFLGGGELFAVLFRGGE